MLTEYMMWEWVRKRIGEKLGDKLGERFDDMLDLGESLIEVRGVVI